ncbi:MAG: HD domain-containing phosphohydrolase [Gemmatimonadota bacterium]
MTTPALSLPRVLCVDDEAPILTGLQRVLRRRYDLVTASNLTEAMDRLRGPAFAVVVSDLRMPGGSGIELLTRIREQFPDATRMLLTGYADVQAAAAAVNEGQVFRFLTKPCPTDILVKAIDAGIEQHRLVTSERVLLEETLHGSVKALIDVLALAQPQAFGRATRIKTLVSSLADLIGIKDRWQLDVAAMLSQIGAVSLPPAVLDGLLHGRELSAAEMRLVDAIPTVAAGLIENIPRLEAVHQILVNHDAPFVVAGANRPAGKQVPLGARLLRVALDYDDLVTRGHTPNDALSRLGAREGRYDPDVLTDLQSVIGADAQRTIAEIRFSDVEEGMIFADNVLAADGTLLVARGQEASAGLVSRIQNFWNDLALRGPVRIVLAPPPAPK